MDIYEACKIGDLESVKKMINSLNADKKRNLLYEVCSWQLECSENNLLIFKYLIECIAKHTNKDILDAILRTCIRNACECNHLDIIKYIVETYDLKDLNEFMYVSCSVKNIEIVKYLVKNGANDFNMGLKAACANDILPIVEYMVELGADSLSGGFYAACFYGSIDIVKYLIKKGVNYFAEGFIASCRSGKVDIIKLLVEEYKVCNYDEGFMNVCCSGNIDALKYMLSLGVMLDFNNGMYHACYCGKYVIVRHLAEEYKVTNVEHGLHVACMFNYYSIVEYLVKKYDLNNVDDANSLYDGFLCACRRGNLEVAQYLVENNKVNCLNTALKAAAESHMNTKLMVYLINKGADNIKVIKREYIPYLLNLGLDPKKLKNRAEKLVRFRNDVNENIKLILLNSTNLNNDVINTVCEFTEYMERVCTVG